MEFQMPGRNWSLLEFAKDIKLAHSVFALPFAAASLVIAPISFPSIQQLAYLVLAMVGARSFAMGANRIIDWKIDAQNPRTRNRAIPAGHLSLAQACFWTGVSALLLILAASMLNPLAGWLSLPLLLILAAYPLWKRFSVLAHWYLGLCLGLAPLAVCVALLGSIPLSIYFLSLAVTLWTAGFDLLYALQDTEFDRGAGLNSLPARWGVRRTIFVSRICFGGMIAGLLTVGLLADFGCLYFVGMGLLSLLLIYEQYLINDSSESKISSKLNMAFFNLNAYVSLAYLLVVIADRSWGG